MSIYVWNWDSENSQFELKYHSHFIRGAQAQVCPPTSKETEICGEGDYGKGQCCEELSNAEGV